MNKELAYKLFEAMNEQDFDVFDSLMDENAILDFPGVERMVGKKKIKVFFKILFRKYKSLTFTVNDVIEDVTSNKYCAIWENVGVEPGGRNYRNAGNTVIHFSGNKIIFLSDYFKDTSFVK